jgi:hypothetical protein
MQAALQKVERLAEHGELLFQERQALGSAINPAGGGDGYREPYGSDRPEHHEDEKHCGQSVRQAQPPE